jgi:diguanylate cyclase (GGDEF)-like protein
VFVHDATGSVYVMLSDASESPIPAGTKVEVRGVTQAGGFAPIVDHARIRVIGYTGLPTDPPTENVALLTNGREDGKWVRVEGIVHSVIEHDHDDGASRRYVTLQLGMEDGTVGVSMLGEAGADYRALVDARIAVEANAAPLFNRNDQVIGARLMSPGLSGIQILEDAPGDPFQQPTSLINDLFRWDNLASERHRVHVRGTVTMVWPGSEVCIRDAARGICSQTSASTGLRLGEIADVVGFVESQNGSVSLKDAVYKYVETGEPVKATPVTAEQALEGKVLGVRFRPNYHTDFDAELISIEGVLIQRDLTYADTALLITSGKTNFTAILPKALSGPEAQSWRVGSRLRITGICSVRFDPSSGVAGGGVMGAKAFQVFMRSPRDVLVLEHPSWWTPVHAIAVLACALTCTLGALLWVISLRKRLQSQASQLKESEEQFRHMALHDALTGLATRLLLNDRLSVALENARRRQHGLALLMLDLDRFKEINDTFGHAAGDYVLCSTAARLLGSVRKSDTVSRLGGDEFVILLTDVLDLESVERLVGKIVNTMSAPAVFEGRQISVSASVGVCVDLGHSLSADELLKNADIALYSAKDQGRNRFQVFKLDSNIQRTVQVPA